MLTLLFHTGSTLWLSGGVLAAFTEVSDLVPSTHTRHLRSACCFSYFALPQYLHSTECTYTMYTSYAHTYNKARCRKMSQWHLRVLVTPVEDSGLSPSTHIVSHSHL